MFRFLSAGLIILLALGGICFSAFAQDYEALFAENKPLAERGYADAQYNLGVMYYSGEGVPENYIKAYQWWSLAAAQGNITAQNNKPKLAKLMTSAQIAVAQRLSAECYTANYKGCE